jgi:hypothetical protein
LAEASRAVSLHEMESDTLESSVAPGFHRIFASYAREGKAIIEAVDSVLRAIDAGQLLWDLSVLRCGDRWEQRVIEEIDKADSFQLFRSVHSRASENVEKEWRYALRLERERFVRPVFWSEPMPAPPGELQHLHFARIQLPRQQWRAAITRRLISWFGRSH